MFNVRECITTCYYIITGHEELKKYPTSTTYTLSNIIQAVNFPKLPINTALRQSGRLQIGRDTCDKC